MTTCVLFDGGSQRTYVTEILRNRLCLGCIWKEKLFLKRLPSTESLLKCLDVVKRKNEIVIYTEALCPTDLCSDRVAPIKKLSIPRLELLSCLLLVELMSTVHRLLLDAIVVNSKYFWNDSEVALAWIKVEGKQWKSWMQNRVNKMKQVKQLFYETPDFTHNKVKHMRNFE